MEVKLMASPSNPLAVAMTQNIGNLITSLHIETKALGRRSELNVLPRRKGHEVMSNLKLEA